MPGTRIRLGNVSIVEKHLPAAVGVDPEDAAVGLAAIDLRTPEGVRAELIDADSPTARVQITRPDLGQQITEVVIPAEDWLPVGRTARTDAREAASVPGHAWRALRASEVVRLVADLWPYHSDSDGPEWVECDSEQYARAIADEFTYGGHECVVGRPDDWEPTSAGELSEDEAGFPPAVTPYGVGELAELERERWAELQAELDESGGPQNLMVNGGRDAAFSQIYDTAAAPARFNYMALTANATAPAAGDTALTGEITTAGGGLLRAQAAFAHTAGTSTGTLTKTFTANGSDALPVTVAKIGLFNASSAGTLGHATLLNSTATLSAPSDNVTVTETITVTPS